MLATFRIGAPASLLAALVALHGAGRAAAQEAVWRVSKSSGEATVTRSDEAPVALTTGALLKPGDTIQTGHNGRALLMRGNETIIISPGSTVGLPAEGKSKETRSRETKGKDTRANSWTTIQLQSGSILLDVEKRDTRHFEVETPYLAAIVKGTQFRVTVDKTDSRVDVLKGKVEVMDFQTGQYALVQPSQAAKVALQGPPGLSLSGSGTLSAIQQGAPRRSSLPPLPQRSGGASGNSPLKAASAPGSTTIAVGSTTIAPGSSPITPGTVSSASASQSPTNEAASGNAPSTSSAPPAQSIGDVMAPSSPATAPSTRSENAPTKPHGWFNVEAPRSRKDEIATSLTLSLAVGGLVTLAVAAQRIRRKKQQHGG